MISKAQSKLLRSLKHKKYRQKYGMFVAEGAKTVLEVLQSEVAVPELIIATPEWIEKELFNPGRFQDILIEIDEKELQRHSSLQQANQAICMLRYLPTAEWKEINRQQVILYLEHLQDPGNLGTIIRIADWFDHSSIICSPDTVDYYNPKVIQASMGSFLRVRMRSVSLEELEGSLPNHILCAADMKGESIYDFEIPDKLVLIIGNESKGVSISALDKVNKRLSIPGNRTNSTDSLNASVATGIMCSVIDHKLIK